ncbi:MAG: HNH endonuclease [bacterium]|nr:HNH endonuclease [bacterium]
MRNRITTPEIDAFIRQHYKGTGPTAMTALVNERFGSSYTREQIKAYYNRNKLNSGVSHRFEKGCIPANKGKTWDEFMSPEGQTAARKHLFKPGHAPHNSGLPVGTVRLRYEGSAKASYWQKVGQPDVWRPKHIVEWEEHNGPVPEGYIITFADGNTLNWSVDNLILETRAQRAVKNASHIHGYDRESAQAANLIADLKMAGRRKRRPRA